MTNEFKNEFATHRAVLCGLLLVLDRMRSSALFAALADEEAKNLCLLDQKSPLLDWIKHVRVKLDELEDAIEAKTGTH